MPTKNNKIKVTKLQGYKENIKINKYVCIKKTSVGNGFVIIHNISLKISHHPDNSFYFFL